ncbi:alkylated DNA repair protein alkB [Achlya hypogyna]|uniref:Alkylated DNA repair protein alkB n=1 Tax=Achlya hypogyna TaxID=1202772 RepID=A0A1V9YGT6_ACHHY|nr:alkylated DNA repair protein alkB [Achlya hypogyna]
MDFRKLLREARAEAARARAPATPAAKQPPPEQDAQTVICSPDQLPPFALSPRSRLTLANHAAPGCAISSIFYIPNWISEQEEAAILARVHAVPPATWVQLKYRRLQVWGGSVTTVYEQETLPEWLQTLSQALVDAGIFDAKVAPNHALINDYGPGDVILPHEDGPMYHPLVAILSTGAPASMTFQRHRATSPNDAPFVLPLARRSLLVFTGAAYTEYLHSIDDVVDDHRISLTIRYVPTASLHSTNPTHQS